MIPVVLRLRWIRMEVWRRHLECTVPNMGSVWSMSDEEVRKLPEFKKITYGEYLKFAVAAQITFFLFPLAYTIPDILTKNIWWPLYLQLIISFIISIWIFWLSYKIRKANREIMVREIMES